MEEVLRTVTRKITKMMKLRIEVVEAIILMTIADIIGTVMVDKNSIINRRFAACKIQ